MTVALLQSITAREHLSRSSGNGLLFQADARALPLADETVDLVGPTSPPYGAGLDYDEGGDVVADEWPAFMAAWLQETYRVARPSGRLVLNVPFDMAYDAAKVGRAKLSRPTYHQAVAAAHAAGWLYAHTITWDKNHHKKGHRGLGSLNSSARPYPVDPTEAVIFFSKGEWGPSSDRHDDITAQEWQEYGHGPWRFPGLARRKGGHPAPFPAELARRGIRYLSRVGDVVLDPFSGSGTTVAVAVAEGRLGIGSDRSRAYLKDSAARIGAAPLQFPERPICSVCDELMPDGRRDRDYCSAACRQRAYRRRKAG